MAVTFRAVSTSGAGNSGDGTEDHAKPTGTVNNTDVLFAALYTDNTGAHSLGGGSTWSQRQTTTWNGWRTSTWTKLAGAAEPTNYTFTFTAGYWAAIIAAYSGCDSSSAAAHYVDSSQNTATSTTATGTGITTTRADSLLIWHAISSVGARSGAPTPGSWSNRSTFDTNMYLDDRAIGAGATGNFTSSYSNQVWVVHLVGLQGPAAATASDLADGGGYARNVRTNPVYRMSPGGIYAPVSYSFAP